MKKEKEIIDSEDLKDLTIEDKGKDFKDYEVKTMDDVLNIDFSKEGDLNLDEAYDFITMSNNKPKETKELIEKREADNIIKSNSSKYLNKDYVDMMNNEHNNLRSMLKKYDVNSEIVKKMSEKDKDKIYGLAEYLFNEYQKKLNDMNFNFPLTNDEWKFMFDVLYNKLEYDQNEIFQLKEVREKYLSKVDELSKTSMNYDIQTVINVNDLIILYHLISKHKVKGINKQHYSYLNILTKIGERIKLFNAYNVWVQRLSTDFQSWGGSLSVDEETVKGVLSDKDKKEK
jgi:hypothetical protein